MILLHCHLKCDFVPYVIFRSTGEKVSINKYPEQCRYYTIPASKNGYFVSLSWNTLPLWQAEGPVLISPHSWALSVETKKSKLSCVS